MPVAPVTADVKQPIPSQLDAYQQRVRRQFARLSSIDDWREAVGQSIVLASPPGYLVPLCEVHRDDEHLIEMLAHWRELNMAVYPTQFPVTLEGTAHWLRHQVLDVEDRLTFLVLDRHGYAIGHMGFANALNERAEMRVDNVMRAVRGAAPGLMAHGLQTLLHWAETTIQPAGIYLVVFDDNHHAIEFYRRLGFRLRGSAPLRRHVEGDRTEYRPLAPDDRDTPDRYHVRMEYALASNRCGVG